MFRTLAIVIAATTTAIVLASPGLANEPHPVPAFQTAPEPGVSAPVAPLTDAERTAIDWATGRFESAGLALPPMTVRFDPTRTLCDGNEGLYRFADGTHTVTICTRDSTSFAAQLERRRTLLHEFAHAWTTITYDRSDHDRLAEIVGGTSWADPTDPWAERTAERIAETLVYGLLDQPARALKIDAACHVLVAAFATLTTIDPLGPGEPWCV